MDTLQDLISKLLLINKPINIYIELLDKYLPEELDLLFYHVFDITFTKEELELKNRRIHQLEFRNNIIDRYRVCIITKFPNLMCEACHIIPFCDSTETQKYDVNNGLLLEAGIHKLFDLYLISINPYKKTVELSKQLLNDIEYNQLHKYHNMKISLHNNTLEYLKTHYKLFSRSIT